MKNILSLLFAAISASFLLYCTGQKTDTAREEAAIRAVIEGEINASIDGDYTKWMTFFVHEPYVVYLQADKNNYLDLKGWDTISVAARNWIRPSRKGTILFGGNTDYSFRIMNDMAWVSFKSSSTLTSDCGESQMTGLEVRTLEKHEGLWKIVYLGSVFSSTYPGAK